MKTLIHNTYKLAEFDFPVELELLCKLHTLLRSDLALMNIELRSAITNKLK